MVQRELTKDMNVNGVTLRPGCHIDLSIYCIHHNPTVWKDPMVSLILKKMALVNSFEQVILQINLTYYIL